MKNAYEVKEDTIVIKVIYLGEEYDYTIDRDAFDFVNAYKGTWHRKSDGYAYANFRKNGQTSQISMQRFLMKPEKHLLVDHINRDVTDNRRRNLRIVTKGQNTQNISIFGNKRNTSGHRNISIRGKKYEVQIKGKYLGRHDTLEKALKVRDENLKILQPFAYECYEDKPSS